MNEFLLSLWGLTVVALVVSRMRIEQSKNEHTERIDHLECFERMEEMVSNRFLAARLRELAVRYDSIEEKATFAELARNNFTSGGSSMPALWLNLQAELLDPTEFNYNEVAIAEYTMEGKRVL